MKCHSTLESPPYYHWPVLHGLGWRLDLTRAWVKLTLLTQQAQFMTSRGKVHVSYIHMLWAAFLSPIATSVFSSEYIFNAHLVAVVHVENSQRGKDKIFVWNIIIFLKFFAHVVNSESCSDSFNCCCSCKVFTFVLVVLCVLLLSPLIAAYKRSVVAIFTYSTLREMLVQQ